MRRLNLIASSYLQWRQWASMQRTFRATCDWQTKLGDVENVTQRLEYRAKELVMESIFMASEDIRAQLPEDTKRFEGIDAEFKDFLREVFGDEGSVPNAVAVLLLAVEQKR